MDWPVIRSASLAVHQASKLGTASRSSRLQGQAAIMIDTSHNPQSTSLQAESRCFRGIEQHRGARLRSRPCAAAGIKAEQLAACTCKIREGAMTAAFQSKYMLSAATTAGLVAR